MPSCAVLCCAVLLCGCRPLPATHILSSYHAHAGPYSLLLLCLLCIMFRAEELALMLCRCTVTALKLIGSCPQLLTAHLLRYACLS
jgi:hypothetical protein